VRRAWLLCPALRRHSRRQPFDGELAHDGNDAEGAFGQRNLSAQGQRAADARALQFGQVGRKHRVPARNGRILDVGAEQQVLGREAAFPLAEDGGCRIGAAGGGLERAGQRVAIALDGGNQAFDLDGLRAERRNLYRAGRAAQFERAGRALPREMHEAETRVERMPVEPRCKPGGGGQPHCGRHADVETQRPGLDRAAPFNGRRRKCELHYQEDSYRCSDYKGQQPVKRRSQGLVHTTLTRVSPP
jgi:hypothetical protein